MNARTNSQRQRNLLGKIRLDVERMEDRLVPGETLSGLLLAPAGLFAIPDLVSSQEAACDGLLDRTVTDEAPAAEQASPFFFSIEDRADSQGVSAPVLDNQRESPAPAVQA
jgi:hypothetical protein